MRPMSSGNRGCELPELQGIRRAQRQPPSSAEEVVRLEQLITVSNVPPLPLESIAVHGYAGHKPCDEQTGLVGLVGRVTVRQVSLHERDV